MDRTGSTPQIQNLSREAKRNIKLYNPNTIPNAPETIESLWVVCKHIQPPTYELTEVEVASNIFKDFQSERHPH